MSFTLSERSSRTARWHLALFALALTLPILAFVAFLLWQYTSSERIRVETRAAALANDVAVSIDRDLTAQIAGLQVLSLSQLLNEGNLDGFYSQATQVQERLGVTPILRDLGGQQLVSAGTRGDVAPRLRLPVDARAIETQQPQISDLFVLEGSKQPQYAIVMPVIRAGRVQYLLTLVFSLERLRGLLNNEDVPATWTVVVVDNGGRIMARNRRHEEFVGRTAAADLLQHATDRRGTWLGDGIEGGKVFGAYNRVSASNWRVSVGVRQDILNQSLTRSFWLLIGLGVAILALGSILAFYFARRITAPMSALSARAIALGRGEPVGELHAPLREAEEVGHALVAASDQLRQRARERDKAVSALSEETQRLDALNRAGIALSGELDLEGLLAAVTSSATRLAGATYGAFFERIKTGGEERWRLASLDGAERHEFERFGFPRMTVLFGPSFRAEGVVRCADVLEDPRYGSMGGMPGGHLPVRSYLAVPVISRSAEMLGVLLFGHPEPGRFGEREEALLVGFAGQASIALDNARLFASVRLEQDRFRAAVAAVRGVLWTNDAQGRMSGEQPGWSALTGQSREQYEGYGWAQAVHPDDAAASVEAWNEAVTHRRTFIHEHRVRRHDGMWRTFAIRAVPVLDNGEIREWVGVHTDITEQREAEAELKESNEEIQRYAYIVSHDLRAPLVNIMGFTSELEAVGDDIRAALGAHPDADRFKTDFDESVTFIKAAIEKMDRLINAILRLSREGRRTFRPEPLDMPKIIRSLADAQRHQADAKDAEVVIGELPEIVADRLAIEQIFGNLIDNAIKYSALDRPGRIEIEGEIVGARVRYSVKDNGRGIAPQDHARVFELFRRSGVQDRPGEGIGLAHVRALVRSLGGRIDLASDLGAGTTFYVTLPRQPTRGVISLAAE